MSTRLKAAGARVDIRLMSGEPRILASFVRGSLDAIDEMDAELGRRVRQEMKPEALEEIENAWGASWLPIGHDVELTASFFRVAGEERACEAMRRNMAETFHKPILRPMIDAAVRVLGLSPPKVLRWAPRVWSLLCRDVGEMRAEIGEDRGTLWLTELPAEVAENRPYLLGSAAAISAVFDLTAVTGKCQLTSHGNGRARIDLRWSES